MRRRKYNQEGNSSKRAEERVRGVEEERRKGNINGKRTDETQEGGAEV